MCFLDWKYTGGYINVQTTKIDLSKWITCGKCGLHSIPHQKSPYGYWN